MPITCRKGVIEDLPVLLEIEKKSTPKLLYLNDVKEEFFDNTHGELIVAECQRVLREEYPQFAEKIRVMLPDENFRRVGQSMAAASLPEV